MPKYIDNDGNEHDIELTDVRLLHDLLDHYLEQMADMHNCALTDDIFIKSAEDLAKVTGSLHEETVASKYMMTLFEKDARAADEVSTK